MKSTSRHLAILAAFVFISSIISAQKADYQLYLKTGKVAVARNLSQIIVDSFNRTAFRWNRAFAVIQFESIPGEESKQMLAAQGIELLDYIPDNAYTASIRQSLNLNSLIQANARAVIKLSPQQKLSSSLANGFIPSWAVKIAGTADLLVSFPKTIPASEVLSHLKQMNIDVVSTDLLAYHIINIRLAANRIEELAGQPFIEYAQPVSQPDQTLNNNSRILSHANVLNASVANGGKGLNGEGVVVGVGDNADVQYHTDFSGRLINRNSAVQTYHGIHTTGTTAGAGIIDERYRGYAPKATIISQYFSGMIVNAPTYVQDYGMVVSNNSYGPNPNCSDNGIYDLSSRVLDQMAFSLPHLQHVFASGNAGNNTCAPYPTGFKTVLATYQSAKNIVCVGNTNMDGVIAGSSSKGPVRDGRLKPEITAQGGNVMSGWYGNTYGANNGTSMAAPGVSGGLVLLYQRYRQLNGNANPQSGLMKALLCNGASDKGNPGPDFSYGFGNMNLLRSLDMLENNHYVSGNAFNNATVTHTIAVPANTSQLKVMLYWHDPASSMVSSKTLVNDLDLEVVPASSSPLLPLILDSAAAKVTDAAMQGADHVNNIEQIMINNPGAGNYTIRVKGTLIAQNPSQEYFVVYDYIPNSLQLTSPVGGEGWVPGENARINWESYGDTTKTFTLQYSADGGSSWSNLSTSVEANSRFFTWQVPSVATDKALVRISKNGTTETSTSKAFTIVGVPAVTLSAVQCEGYININWAAVSGATGYEVMMLRGDEMVPVATTSSLSYTFSGLTKDSIYWVSVRAGVNGKWGRRAVAISRLPNSGTCSGSISDRDLKLNAIVAPVSGRKATSTELTASAQVKIEVKNTDDVPVTGFTVKYSIDGGTTWVTENVSATIAPNVFYTHTFATTANLSALGNYHLVAVVKNNAGDPVTANDTARAIVKHLDNQPVSLAVPFVDDLESATSETYINDITGLNGLSRYDYINETTYGRLRTFVNSGMALSGSKALTLDVDRYTSGSHVNYLIGTFNLANYNVNTNQVRLNFQYCSHGTNSQENNKVWIRGNDTSPWIEMFSLFADQFNIVGQYRLSPGIVIADSLIKYGQNFSSSFQVKWAQNTILPATEKNAAGGVSFDDIRLTEAINDVHMLSIDTPASFYCRPNTLVPLKISVKNDSRNSLTNVPVKYSVNGGSWVSETLPSLPGSGTVQFTFNSKIDLSQAGMYTIKVVADYPSDSYRLNDTVITVIQSAPLITSFPYLENFEQSNGGWFASGTVNSWEYGTPASLKINRAASGAKAWKTKLAGGYNNQELSFLYSPCFNISSMTKPTLSLSLALDIENCGINLCDAAWVDYSEDGKIWKRLMDMTSSSLNWFNAGDRTYWSEEYPFWHVATVELPKGLSELRLRFAMYADRAVTAEGIALDDIHVYDNTKGIYNRPAPADPITQTISGGTGFVDFESNGKLIASVQPNNQNLGSTAVQLYVNMNAVRYTDSQYYHNRSITVKPQNSYLNDSATLRIYFLESEMEVLRDASGCDICIAPTSAYQLGVTKYDDYVDSLENGTLEDNRQGRWTYIPYPKVAMVPFDRGYYAEFKVKGFSEFWLNAGGFKSDMALPVKLLDFTARKMANGDVQVDWSVASEMEVDHYEIEMARDYAGLQNNKFEKIGSVDSKGNSASQQEYSFIDGESNKSGVRYYRLKTINRDGSYFYSLVRSIIFTDDIKWYVYPNPSNGKVELVYQLNDQETLTIHLKDMLGRTVKSFTITGDGFVRKATLDFSESRFSSGLYLLQIPRGDKMQIIKIIKR